jgi:hypothetical protein
LCNFSVHDYRWNTADTKLFGPCRYLRLAHVQHFRFTRWACQALYCLYCIVTRRAASAKDFDFAFVAHKSSSFFSRLYEGKAILNPVVKYRVKRPFFAYRICTPINSLEKRIFM